MLTPAWERIFLKPPYIYSALTGKTEKLVLESMINQSSQFRLVKAMKHFLQPLLDVDELAVIYRALRKSTFKMPWSGYHGLPPGV